MDGWKDGCTWLEALLLGSHKPLNFASCYMLYYVLPHLDLFGTHSSLTMCCCKSEHTVCVFESWYKPEGKRRWQDGVKNRFMSHVTGALAESDLLMAAQHESMRRLFGECCPLSVRAAAEVLGSVSVCVSGRDCKAVRHRTGSEGHSLQNRESQDGTMTALAVKSS